jgi:hypothetical protein
MHNEKIEFTYRTKDRNKKSRLDYGLISPTLIPHLKTVTHTAHHYGVTDHSSLSITLDIMKSKRGKGTFKCAPNLHQAHNLSAVNPKYHSPGSLHINRRNSTDKTPRNHVPNTATPLRRIKLTQDTSSNIYI